MHQLEQEIQTIVAEHQAGNLSLEEKNYLLQEIRDVKAAQECSSDERMFRYLVQACNVAMAVV
jgi:hypothetical protein